MKQSTILTRSCGLLSTVIKTFEQVLKHNKDCGKFINLPIRLHNYLPFNVFVCDCLKVQFSLPVILSIILILLCFRTFQAFLTIKRVDTLLRLCFAFRFSFFKTDTDEDCAKQVLISGIQLLGNLVVQHEKNQEIIWERCYPSFFM